MPLTLKEQVMRTRYHSRVWVPHGRTSSDRRTPRSRSPLTTSSNSAQAGILLGLQSAFDTAVRNQPEEGNDGIQRISQPWTDEGERDRGQVDCRRELAFPVTAQSHRQQRLASFTRNNGALQNVVRDCGQQEDHAVDRRRRGRGAAAARFSPIHAVAKGKRDSQNRRWR